MRRPAPGIGGLARDRRGAAAIEFALIAPVAILIYFGLVELSQGFMAQRRAGHVASTVADLVSQGDQTSKADMDAVFAVGDLIMRPFTAGSRLSIRVSSVTMDKNGVARVDWVHGKGSFLSARSKGDVVADMPAGVIESGQTAIMGETQYAYRSPFGAILPKPVTLKRRYFLRPRTMDRIPCADC